MKEKIPTHKVGLYIPYVNNTGNGGYGPGMESVIYTGINSHGTWVNLRDYLSLEQELEDIKATMQTNGHNEHCLQLEQNNRDLRTILRTLVKTINSALNGWVPREY